MKHWRLKLILTTLCCLLFFVAVKYLPSIVHSDEVSDVYRRYEHRDDLKVGYIKDYRIDDSTTVDVTTLTARDSASWETLLKEMNIPDIKIELLRKSYRKGNQSVSSYYCVKNHPEQRSDKDCNDVDLVLYLQNLKDDRTFFIFHLTSKDIGNKVLFSKTKEINNLKKQ